LRCERGISTTESRSAAPIALEENARPESLTEAAGMAVKALERFVSAHPTQWFHFG
jgi:predicted LPLAT superfamily acyltransferase